MNMIIVIQTETTGNKNFGIHYTKKITNPLVRGFDILPTYHPDFKFNFYSFVKGQRRVSKLK